FNGEKSDRVRPSGRRRGAMRRIRDVLGLCGLLLAVIGGCTSDSTQLRPPQPPQEVRAPPEARPRYFQPIQDPPETMDQASILKKAKDTSKASGAPGGGRSGGGGLGAPGVTAPSGRSF